MHELKRITEELRLVEGSARELQLTSNERKGITEAVVHYGENFIEELKTRDAFKKHSGQAISEAWQIDFPTSIETVLNLIKDEMDSTGLIPSSEGHLGYIPGSGIYPAALGDYIAAVNNHYAGVHFAGPAAVELENYLIQWMGEILDFSPQAVGNLTSGGSIANLIAIVTARDRSNVMEENPRDFCIYMSKQSHHSLDKAIRIAGLNQCRIRIIEVDEHYRLDVESLRELIEVDISHGKVPFLCIANVGTTDTGAIDPVEDIADICTRHNIWLHLDAAYGGFFKMVEEDVTVPMDKLHLADSLTVDPHKGLFLPYGTGACIFKDVSALSKSFHYQAGYMQDAVEPETISPADVSPELTKHFRGMRMWLPLKLLGLDRFKASLKEKLWLCRYFYHKIQEMGFEVGPYPDLSVMIYRYTDTEENLNKFNKRLVEKIHADGAVFISSTTINDIFWLRLAVLNFRTHKETIDRCLAMIRRCLEKSS